nr:hypothetical protein GCM10020093_002090 [Planobispora longispora]
MGRRPAVTARAEPGHAGQPVAHDVRARPDHRGRGGYRLGPGVAVDLDRAAELVGEAENRLTGGEPALALAAARGAADLLAAEVLVDQPDALWAEPARAGRAGLLRRARHAAAEAAIRTRNPAGAVAAAEAAIGADPSTRPPTGC